MTVSAETSLAETSLAVATRLGALLPAEAGPAIRESLLILDQRIELLRPARPHALLDDPAVIAAFERDGYMPYWAELWPAARLLAEAVLKEDWPSGLHALELGCGLGLVGLAALAKGLRVTFSDYDPSALRFAAENARLNGFSDFEVLHLDWRRPPALRFHVILAADVIYEKRNVPAVVDVLRGMLAPGGMALLSDQDRTPADSFRQALSRAGLSFQTLAGGTLYRIQRGQISCS